MNLPFLVDSSTIYFCHSKQNHLLRNQYFQNRDVSASGPTPQIRAPVFPNFSISQFPNFLVFPSPLFTLSLTFPCHAGVAQRVGGSRQLLLRPSTLVARRLSFSQKKAQNSQKGALCVANRAFYLSVTAAVLGRFSIRLFQKPLDGVHTTDFLWHFEAGRQRSNKQQKNVRFGIL